MLPESLRNSEHNSTLRNSEHISTLKTKYLLKYVPMLCAYIMIIINKCTLINKMYQLYCKLSFHSNHSKQKS